MVTTETKSNGKTIEPSHSLSTTEAPYAAHAKHPAEKRKAKGALNPFLLPVVIGVVAVAAVGVTPRIQNQMELAKVHQQLTASLPELSATVAKAAAKSESLSLPGDLQPVQNIPSTSATQSRLVNC